MSDDFFNCDNAYRFINSNLPKGLAEIQVGWLTPDVEDTRIIDLNASEYDSEGHLLRAKVVG